MMFLGIRSGVKYRSAVVMAMYIAPLSTFVSSEVIAATLSFAVSPFVNATVIVSPTSTPCLRA